MGKETAAAGRAFGAVLAAVLAVLASLAVSGTAWASESSSLQNAGNLVGVSGADAVVPAQTVERDVYWAGGNFALKSLDVKGDIVAAGANVDVVDCDVAGSVRVAGMNLTISNVTAQNNFTVAGQNIELTACEAQGGVYLAGEKVSFSGSAGGALLAGATVYLDGTIDGDAFIEADSVELGPNAAVTGQLRIVAEHEPTVSPTAQLADYEFTLDEDESGSVVPSGFSLNFNVPSWMGMVVAVLGVVALALLFQWLFRRPVEAAAQMTRVHAGRVFGTGAVALIAAPLVILFLLAIVFTWQASVSLMFALLALGFVAVPFSAAAFARLALPKMNRFGSAAIGGAVLGLVTLVPVLGMVVALAADIYLLGYVIQSLWVSRKVDDGAPEVEACLPEPVGKHSATPVPDEVEGGVEF